MALLHCSSPTRGPAPDRDCGGMSPFPLGHHKDRAGAGTPCSVPTVLQHTQSSDPVHPMHYIEHPEQQRTQGATHCSQCTVQCTHSPHSAPRAAPSTPWCSTAAKLRGAECGCGREQGWGSWVFGEVAGEQGVMSAGQQGCRAGVVQGCGSASHSCVAVLVGAVLTGDGRGADCHWWVVAAFPEGLVALLGGQLTHVTDVLTVVGLEAFHDVFGDSSPFLRGAEQGERSHHPT